MFVGEGGKGWLPGGFYVTRVHTLRCFIPSLFPRKLFARWRGHAVNLLFFLDVNFFAYRWHNSRSFIFRCFIKWPIKYLSHSSHTYSSWRLCYKCFMIGVDIEFLLTHSLTHCTFDKREKFVINDSRLFEYVLRSFAISHVITLLHTWKKIFIKYLMSSPGIF